MKVGNSVCQLIEKYFHSDIGFQKNSLIFNLVSD